jgi:cytosine/adenosine deaminase-related metal-dependent hydrolase
VDWAHSLQFEPDLPAVWKRRRPGRPFVIHAAEGTDAEASREIDLLDKMGMLTKDTVLVHALALTPAQIALVKDRGCSVVFCPQSNLATYGRTLGLDVLRSGIAFALGSDSPITFEGDLRDDIAAALQLGLTSDEVYRMVTTAPAEILRLENGEGVIAPGHVADLTVVKDRAQTPGEALLDLEPELVMVGGRVKLAADRMNCTLAGSGVVG